MSDWRIVRTVGTEEEAALAVGFLGASGIDARVESLLFHQEPVNFGKLGEVRILVPAASFDEAEQALAAADEGDDALGLGDAAATDSDPQAGPEPEADDPPRSG